MTSEAATGRRKTQEEERDELKKHLEDCAECLGIAGTKHQQLHDLWSKNDCERADGTRDNSRVQRLPWQSGNRGVIHDRLSPN
ncbi:MULTISPECIES: hypothetical protein [Pseudarthrobacter]|uniref:hypothetical protein n=1 Tax=Pseudarthrobacter TaxID=1742993 RepID=UPI0013DAC691|nr:MULTISPECIES: hypothetical protein [Pseudarthrobacter]MDQ0000448.1 hypothetical protein [Pseudarthrobacter sulfonivorans]